MKEIKSPEEKSCENCAFIYVNHKKCASPISCHVGSQWKTQFAVTSEEIEKAKQQFLVNHIADFRNYPEMSADLDHLLDLAREEKKDGWSNYGPKYPPLGIEVIAYNESWIDEDYNPKGIRAGFQNLSEDEDGEFISARWNNEQDYYMTIEDEKPTHWMPMPEFTKLK